MIVGTLVCILCAMHQTHTIIRVQRKLVTQITRPSGPVTEDRLAMDVNVRRMWHDKTES